MPSIVIPIWTFVKSEIESSEIILWPGGIVTFFIFWINSKLFFTREKGGVMLFEMILLQKEARLYVGLPQNETIGLRGKSGLCICILGNPYDLAEQELCDVSDLTRLSLI